MDPDTHDDYRAFGRGSSSEQEWPDVTTMAGMFQAAWMQLAPLGSIEPLVVLQALPGAWQDDCVDGPDGEPWRIYRFTDGSSLMVDGYATRFVTPHRDG